MKRDFSLIREILLECEKSEDRWFTIGIIEEGDWEPDLKTSLSRNHLLQVDLMAEAGLIRKENVFHPGLSGPEKAEVKYELTLAGYDYLDAVRDDKIWSKTKAGAASLGGVTLGIMKDIAIGYLKQQVTEKLGITTS